MGSEMCIRDRRTQTLFPIHSDLAKIVILTDGLVSVMRLPDSWDLAEDDNAEKLINRVGLGGKWGDPDIFVLSIEGVTKKENPDCGEKGGKNGTGATNNIWEPYEDWLCEDFVYAGWRHCESLYTL